MTAPILKESAVSTTNACKLCTPMGASLAFRGIEGAVPFLHGSQGCATYMRRYIISHFNEPIDIASSSLGEKNAVFGGGPNLKLGLANVTKKYRPQLVGIATTCLTETIGDDVPMFLKEYQMEKGTVEKRGKGVENVEKGTDLFSPPGGGSGSKVTGKEENKFVPFSGPLLVHVSTPSYSGTHMEGFHAAVRAVVEQLAGGGEKTGAVNLLPGFVSAEDLRHLKEVLADFGLPATVLPDYSDTLDGPALRRYPLIPEGGTKIADIRAMGRARATVEFGRTLTETGTAGTALEQAFAVPRTLLGLPMGVRETDRFFEILSELSGRPVPAKYAGERGRLIDSYVDGHKYLSGKRAVVFGEEDLVAGLVAFLAEIGIVPVLCASGGASGRFREAVMAAAGPALTEEPLVHEGVDFHEIEEIAASFKPDFLIGHSKGYQLARRLSIPLIRVGFPIHDRLGGQRILHLGYRGAQGIFDTVVNTLIAGKQDGSPIGYSYM